MNMTGEMKMTNKSNKIDVRKLSYMVAVSNFGYDNNASIDKNKNLANVVKSVEEYIDNGWKESSFHISIFLMKLLHVMGLDSELVLTNDVTILEDGTPEVDVRASVLLYDEGKYMVMNPVEDIKYFEDNNIPINARENEYYEGTTILNGKKNGINSEDAGSIPLDEFIIKYGHGAAWIVGSIFRSDFQNITLNDLLKEAKLIKKEEYTYKKQK